MSRIADRKCLCCGAEFLRGCVIDQCSRGCDFDWCRKCTKCLSHCSCPGRPDPFLGGSPVAFQILNLQQQIAILQGPDLCAAHLWTEFTQLGFRQCMQPGCYRREVLEPPEVMSRGGAA